MTEPTAEQGPGSPVATSSDPLEIAFEEVAASATHAGLARTLLMRQTRLIEMQIQQIRLRRGLFAALASLVVGVLAVTFWNAWRDRSVVIQTFATPSDLDAQGLSGEVLASLMLDKLQAIDDQTESWRARATLTHDWSSDLKVEIPNTGISLGQLDRGLHRWLGRQTRIDGNVFHRGNQLVVAVRTGNGGAHAFAGEPSAIDGLLEQAAEALFADTQSYLYSKYLEQRGDLPQALAVARKQAMNGPDSERSWAYAQISNLLTFNDLRGAVDAGRKSVALDPDNAMGTLNLAGAELLLGHDEDGLRDLRVGSALARSDRGGLTDVGRTFGLINRAEADDLAADYSDAIAIYSSPLSDVVYADYARIRSALLAYAMARNHDVAGADRIDGVLPDAELINHLFFWDEAILPGYERRAQLDDWTGALADLDDTIQAAHTMASLGPTALDRFLNPYKAYALARLGRFVDARALIDTTPPDCYLCVRMRGAVAALAGDATRDQWFTQAVAQAPSLAAAYFEWGRARFDAGDLDGAIALFKQAQVKSPHWADPWKLEGDALMRMGKPTLAQQRYIDASKRAPQWGALQLAWGKSLVALGQTDRARDHFQRASQCSLSAADHVEVAKALGTPPI